MKHHIDATYAGIIGTVTLERYDASSVPAAIKPLVTQLRSAHQDLLDASARATQARTARHAAQLAVVTATGDLKTSVETLAVEVVHAGLGKRRDPFAAYGVLRPSRFTEVARTRGMRDLEGLLERVEATSPPPSVVRASKACRKAIQAVEGARAEVTSKGVAFDHAAGDRVKAHATFAATFDRVKIQARAAWIDDPAAFTSVYKRIPADRFGVKKKHAPQAAPPAPPATPPPH